MIFVEHISNNKLSKVIEDLIIIQCLLFLRSIAITMTQITFNNKPLKISKQIKLIKKDEDPPDNCNQAYTTNRYHYQVSQGVLVI